MHLNNVTHRDLKLENLLLARPNDISSVVIADFGLARNAKTARQVFQTQCGTPSYVAPEILLGKPYTPAVDVWSMGCILGELLAGAPMFPENSDLKVFQKICERCGAGLAKAWPESFQQLPHWDKFLPSPESSGGVAVWAEIAGRHGQDSVDVLRGT